MTNPLKRGEVWLADLNPTQGSEQAGIRPVIIFQNNLVSQFSTTTIAIPLTTNQRRAALPVCLLIEQGNGGLSQDSVALCFQMRVLDKQEIVNLHILLKALDYYESERGISESTRKTIAEEN
jgi:mRNA interferase MazF